MKKITFIILAIIGLSNLNAQTLVINEVMSNNTSVITDDDGDYNDWIEIYYNGPEAMDLQGYGLSDDATLPFKWVFPEYWIEPGQHLLIWCSDKNRTDINYDLHTNFKISSGGEIIKFTKPDGTAQDSYPAVLIGNNLSYGRQTDGAATLVFFGVPTPAAANNTPGYNSILTKPVINTASGFYTSSFSLSIIHPDPTVTIVYTTDGSDPDINNLSGTNYNYKNKYIELAGQTSGSLLQNSYKSFTYTAPITVADRTSQANDLAKMSSTFQNNPTYIPTTNLFKGTVVKARAYKTGSYPSEIVTKTFFVTPLGASRFSIPVVSLSLTETKLFDYTNGIFVAGKDFDDWRAANPTEDADYNNVTVGNENANYVRTGDGAEKTANLSYFVNGLEVLNQNIGIEINGGNSRGFQSKAFRLLARSEYGSDKMNFPFFSNEPYSSYKRLLLRNSGQDFRSTMFRDGFMHTLLEKLNTETKSYQPSVVFVNGEYWGILNFRERYDRFFFQQKYNIAEGELDYLKNDLTPEEGDQDHYNAMVDYLNNNSLVSDANYNYIKTQLDPENMRDYYISNIYGQNTDWPGWNTIFWRKRTASYEPNAPFGQDGRWRTGMNDLDSSMGEYPSGSNHNTLEFATATGVMDYPNPEWATLILRKLLENNTFKINFINRFADLLNTYLSPTRVNSEIQVFHDRIVNEIPEHQARWKGFYDVASWNDFSIQVMRDFANQRPNNQRSHIRSKFGIAGDINVTLDVSNTSHGYIKMNTVNINSQTPGVATAPYPWTGIYFKNIPVTMKAIPLPGYVFSHWSGASTSTSDEITLTSSANISVKAHFVPDGTGNQDVPIYFWMFGDGLANDLPLTSINSTYEVPAEGVLSFQSCLSGYPYNNTSTSWRKASMERRNSETDLNYLQQANNGIAYADANVKGIQIKQPFQNGSNQNTLTFSMPTTGYRDVKFSFAAKNELAADALVIDYAVNSGTPTWITTGLTATSLPLTADYQVYTIDFSSIPTADNNANFKIRIRFSGTNMTADMGNRVTFNNISLKGVTVDLDVKQVEKMDFIIYPNPVSDVLNISHQYLDVDYAIFSIDGKMIKNGKLDENGIYVDELKSGIYLLQLHSDGKSETKKFIKK